MPPRYPRALSVNEVEGIIIKGAKPLDELVDCSEFVIWLRRAQGEACCDMTFVFIDLFVRLYNSPCRPDASFMKFREVPASPVQFHCRFHEIPGKFRVC